MRTKEARRPAAGMHLAPGANHGQLACASAPSVEDNGLCPRHRFFCLGLRSAGHPAGRASWLPFVPFSAIPWAFPPFMDRPAKAIFGTELRINCREDAADLMNSALLRFSSFMRYCLTTANASCLERNQGLRQIHRLCREHARQCPRFSKPGTGIAPEIYPCAIALGLEKAWGAMFAGLCLGRFHEGRTLERGCLQQASAQGRPVAASTARLVLRLSQIFQAGRAVARCMRM